MASSVISLQSQVLCFVFYFFYFPCFSIFSYFHFVSCTAYDECESITYAQPKTKITYYDCAHTIDKEHLYTYVAKPILQDFVVSIEINENATSEDEKLLFSKNRYFLKVRGNWYEYPLKKLEDICLGFIHKTDDQQNDVADKREKKNEITEEEQNPCIDAFTSGEAYITCYKENYFSERNLFLYFELSTLYLKSLVHFYNIPIMINVENDIIYLTNSKNDEPKKKVNLNLHVCYQSSMEKDINLGKMLFTAYPLNIERNLIDEDYIYTSFLTNDWNYNIFINGKYLTSYNRLVFVSIPKGIDTTVRCGPFWNYAVLGAGPTYKIKKKNQENFLDHSLKYVFSNNTSGGTSIPFLKNDELKMEYKYQLCLYSDENDFQGMAIRNIQFSINTTDSIVLILLIIFIIIFLPIIFFFTYFCILLKIKFLNSRLKKLQLVNRKDEIEERLKAELKLEEYEVVTWK